MIVFLRSGQELPKSRDQRLLRQALLSSVLLIFSDMIWFNADQSWFWPVPVLMVLKIIYFWSSSFMTYCWFILFESYRGSRLWSRRLYVLLAATPMIVHFILLLFNVKHGFLYYYDGSVYLRGKYFLLQYLLIYPEVLVTCLICLVKAFQPENYTKHERYMFIAAFPIAPAICGIAQLFYWRLPVLCAGTAISALIFYMDMLKSLISRDPLTGLNNRRSLLRDIDGIVREHGNDGTVTLCMIDLDHFKSINDRYGHLEGDQALLILTEALKETAKPYQKRPIIGRFGGDEFIVVLDQATREQVQSFRVTLSDQLMALSKNRKKPYIVEASIGTAINKGFKDIPAWIQAADDAMYAEKLRHHSTRSIKRA
ncbi:MAG: GGDEF domain-containing protein, partial [Oribacterium sp.]|nr:GGDEF domain-containing protein [Oribacterium sp.]